MGQEKRYKSWSGYPLAIRGHMPYMADNELLKAIQKNKCYLLTSQAPAHNY